MKAILLLCLIVSISSFDLIKGGLCLMGNEKIRSLVKDSISNIKNQEYSQLINLILTNYKDIKNILIQCFKEDNFEKDENDDVILKCMDYDKCIHNCEEYHPKSNLCRAACVQWACPKN